MSKHLIDSTSKAITPAADEPSARRSSPPADVRRRLLDREAAADYLGTSSDTVMRLISTGQLPIVKLPVERGVNGLGKVGISRRVLIDIRDLDLLIEQSKEIRR